MHNINVNFSVRGEFDLYAAKVVDGVEVGRRHLHSQENLITNYGMNWFGGSGRLDNWGTWVRVGSGTTPPAYTDSALVSQVASVNRGSSEGANFTRGWGTGPDARKAIFTTFHTFGTGVAAGNLTELGLSDASTGNTLQTRTLFVDGSGNPITVTVLSDEQLIVIYRTIFTVVETDSVLNTTTSPTPTAYTLTMRPANLGGALPFVFDRLGVFTQSMNAYTGVTSGIGPVTGGPTGTINNVGGTYAYGTYTPGSYTRTDTYTVAASSSNHANIGAWAVTGVPFQWQIGISPRLTKVSPETLKFTVTISWSRA